MSTQATTITTAIAIGAPWLLVLEMSCSLACTTPPTPRPAADPAGRRLAARLVADRAAWRARSPWLSEQAAQLKAAGAAGAAEVGARQATGAELTGAAKRQKTADDSPSEVPAAPVTTEAAPAAKVACGCPSQFCTHGERCLPAAAAAAKCGCGDTENCEECVEQSDERCENVNPETGAACGESFPAGSGWTKACPRSGRMEQYMLLRGGCCDRCAFPAAVASGLPLA